MYKKILVPLTSFTLLVPLLILALISCAGSISPASSGTAGLAQTKSTENTASSRTSVEDPWKIKLDALVKSAQRDRQVVIYSSLGAEPRVALSAGFKKRYGITAEFFAGRGGEISEKLISESRAGLRLADVYLGGNTTTFTQLKPLGIVAPLAPFLVFPEVTEPGAWFGKKLSYSDAEGTSLPFAAYAVIPLAININLVRTDEVPSYKSLLNPQWKGKIILSDPTIAGGPAKWFGAMIMPDKLGIDYMRTLAAQEPVITRDRRLEMDWVAHGKYAILIGPKSEIATEFTKQGAPVKFLTPAEGTHWTAGSANISIIKKASHPDAAVLFTNWLLSREGQEAFVKASGLPSARIDVSTEGVDPLMIPQPGVAYLDSNTEEFVIKQTEQMKLAKEIFGPLMK